jgi:hypothetical protein
MTRSASGGPAAPWPLRTGRPRSLPQLAVACQSGGTCLLAPGDLPDYQHGDDPEEDLDTADGDVVDKGVTSCLRGWLVEERGSDQQAIHQP